ncbi:MAG: tRNA pseudouridine(38-40) synthase TruA [Desulfovibrio sp.]|nr:tRNA pseudouridine(38-40) synthase TruA [Desulfovibrio sp.]
MRIRLLLAYIGTNYHGWQLQAEEEPKTIQGILERVLKKLSQESLRVTGSGRTDAGVHATGQVAHITLSNSHRFPALARSLNALLPPDIRVLGAKPCREDFHARFDAVDKTYTYRFWTEERFLPPHKAAFTWNCGTLDVASMQRALAFFLGRHDFASLQNKGTDVASSIRELLDGRITALPNEPFFPPYSPEIELTVRADGFLKQMVRNLAGILWAVGKKQLTPEHAAEILAMKAREKNPCRTAPPEGLSLVHVRYGTKEDDEW